VASAVGSETSQELDERIAAASDELRKANAAARRAEGGVRSATALAAEAYRASRRAVAESATIQVGSTDLHAGGAFLEGFGRLWGMGYFQLGLGQEPAQATTPAAQASPYASVYQLATTAPNVPTVKSKASAWEILNPVATWVRGKREKREDKRLQQITNVLLAQQQKVVAAELERAKAMEALRGQFRTRVARRLAEIEAEAATTTAYVAHMRKDMASAERFPEDLAAEVEATISEFELGIQSILGGANEIGPHTAEQVQYGELSNALVALHSISQRAGVLAGRVKQAAAASLASDQKLAALVRRRDELEASEQYATGLVEERFAAQAADVTRQIARADAQRQAMIDSERQALSAALARLRVVERNAELLSRFRRGS
jgi:hypothetical protein